MSSKLMKKEVLFKTLKHVFTNGVSDPQIKAMVKGQLLAMDTATFNDHLTEFVHDSFVSQQARTQGFGISHVKSFLEWLETDLKIGV